MADDLCAPFTACENLDCQLLIARTADGPSLAVDVAEIPFGPVSMAGATLHPYIRWTYGQTWKTREACLGPVRSVLGLAPGETVTIEVTHSESVDITNLVRDAAERSDNSSRAERPTPVQVAAQAVATAVTPATSLEEKLRQQQQLLQQQAALLQQEDFKQKEQLENLVELLALHYTDLGSAIIQGPGLPRESPAEPEYEVLAPEATRTAALTSIAKQLMHEAAGVTDTINAAILKATGETLDEVHRAETRNTTRERRSTSRETTEQRVRRTFSNPYRDRSLELRFMSVFRRFEVNTSLVKAEPGLLLRPGLINFAVAGARAKLGTFIETQVKHNAVAVTAAADPGAEPDGAAARRHAALTDHLTTNAPVYTRRLVDHTHRAGNRDALLTAFTRLVGSSRRRGPGPATGNAKGLAGGLAWLRTAVRNGEIHVPLAEQAHWPREWEGEAADELRQAIERTIVNPAWLGQWTLTKSVHLFMGTHVEAVAGTCVLADVPPAATG